MRHTYPKYATLTSTKRDALYCTRCGTRFITTGGGTGKKPRDFYQLGGKGPWLENKTGKAIPCSGTKPKPS